MNDASSTLEEKGRFGNFSKRTVIEDRNDELIIPLGTQKQIFASYLNKEIIICSQSKKIIEKKLPYEEHKEFYKFTTCL